MLGKYLGKGQVECHCVGFPQGGNYSRGIGDALKNESGQLITKLAQKLATIANGSFLEGNEGNMEEIGGRMQSWENL